MKVKYYYYCYYQKKGIIKNIVSILAGVYCFDALKNEYFTLHANVLSWSGDTPGLAKLMCTTGHNSYMGCRYCELKGVLCKTNNHVYFPLRKMNDDQTTYDPYNIPYRQHNTYSNVFKLIKDAKNDAEYKDICKNYGKYFIIWCILFTTSN